MRTLRTLLLASSFLVLQIGTGHAQTPPPRAPGSTAAAPAPSAQPAPPEAAPADTAAPAATTDAAAPPAAGTSSGKLPPLRTDDAVAGGIGLASIVVGLALVGAAAGIQGDISSAAPKDLRGNPVCSARGASGDGGATPDLGKCADLRSKASLGSALGNTGVAFMITGGLLAGAAAAYWLLASPSPGRGPRAAGGSPSLTVRVVPAVGATFGGLVVVGSF